MADSSAIRAGRAFVELFADDSKLVRGLKAASTKLKAWGAGIRSLGTKVFAAGAGLLAPMLLSVRNFMSTGDALDKMSGRVGASVEFLSALSHAAQIGGTDIAAMEVGIRRMQRTAMDATRGLSTAVDAFGELGISVTDSSGKLKSTEQLFMESAAALAKVDNNTKKAALSTMIFGRAGTQLLPMLKDGADGLAAVMEEAKRLGLVMSTEDATAAAELTDAWTRLKSSLKMAVIQIGAALAPALRKVADWLTKIGRPLIDWIRQNKKLVVTVAAVAAGVMAGGAALVVLGTIISAAGTVVGALATGLSIIGSVLGALLSPIGLVVAAFGTILYKTGVLSSALNWLGGVFRGLKDIATRAFKGIADAIAAGDLRLAIKIAGAALKVVWGEAMLWVRRQWNTVVFGLAKGLTNAWYAGLKTFTHVVNTMRVAWASFTTWAGNTWNKAQESIGTVFLDVLGEAGVLDEQELAIAKEELSGQMQKKIRARTAAAQESLAAIDREWEAKIEELNQRQADALKALDEDKEGRLSEAKAALAEARNQFAELVEEAERKRARGTIYGMPQKKGPGEPDMEGVTKASVMGTFSAVVAARLGAGGPAERTARATEEAAGHLKFIRRRFEFTGPTTSTFQ